jgi:hypothetical protein
MRTTVYAAAIAAAALATATPAVASRAPALVKAGTATQYAQSLSYQPAGGVRYVAADDENCTPQTVVPFLQAHGANVLRYIVPANPAETYQGIQCVAAARAAGYKTYLSIQYPASDDSAGINAWFSSVIAAYGPQWAIAVGNEEPVTPTLYESAWAVAEPVVAADDPTAIRVGGENFPWAIAWDQQVLATGLPGMQAYAEHCYNTTTGGLVLVPQVAADATAAGVPLWCSEMAPATSPTAPSFFAPETLAKYDTEVRQVVSMSPNLQMLSYYVWPSIGAN